MKRGPRSGVRGPDHPTDQTWPGRGREPESRTPGTPAAAGRLFVVATPIGNLGDLSPRARDVLAGSSLILAEDTRRVRKLLTHFGVRTPVHALHEHNEARETPRLLTRVAAGEDLALVSDAGTPLLADPGFRLVRACRDAGIAVLAVPGPSAVAAALSVAGLPPYPFTFAGFLPAAAAARRTALEAVAALPHTLVVFLSPHRLGAELAACALALGGEREAALLAELTKLHERCTRGTLAGLAAGAADATPRGEFTLVVAPAPAGAGRPAPTREDADRALRAVLAEGLGLADARREAARRLGISRRDLYRMLSRD